MDEFYKKISLGVELNKTDMRSVRKSLQDLGEGIFDEETLQKIEKSLDDNVKKQTVIAKLQRDIETLRKAGNKEAKKGIDELQKELDKLVPKDMGSELTKATSVKKLFTDLTTSLVSSLVRSLKSLFNDALERLNNMQQYSRMTDSSVRDLKLSYGFSSAQAYGYSEAMDLLGIGSMEDLMWADQQQLEMFRRAFNEYTEYYEEVMTPEFTQAQLEYQFEMRKFKTDMQTTLIKFFVDNEDAIVVTMKGIMSIAQVVINIFSWLTEHFGGGRSEAAVARDTSSIINQYKTSSRNVSANVTNTYHISQNDPAAVQNASNLAYKQAIDVLKRG